MYDIVNGFNALPSGSRTLILEHCDLLARRRAADDGIDADFFLDLARMFQGRQQCPRARARNEPQIWNGDESLFQSTAQESKIIVG